MFGEGGGEKKEQQGPGIEIDMKSLILPQMLAHGPMHPSDS